MSKKSIVNRQKKREKVVARFQKQREELLKKASDLKLSPQERFKVRLEMQKLPRDAFPTRLRIRCSITGRPRGVYRKFGLSRSMIRQLAMRGEIPGVVKSSW